MTRIRWFRFFKTDFLCCPWAECTLTPRFSKGVGAGGGICGSTGRMANASAELKGLRFRGYGDFPAFPVPTAANLPAADVRPAAAFFRQSMAFLNCALCVTTRRCPLPGCGARQPLRAAEMSGLQGPMKRSRLPRWRARHRLWEPGTSGLAKHGIPVMKEAKAELERAEQILIHAQQNTEDMLIETMPAGQ